MNSFFSSAAAKLNPLIGLVITVAGALVGGKLAGDAPLGVLLGIIGGSAVALGLCGAIAMLSQVVDAIEQPTVTQAAAPAAYAVAAAAPVARPTAPVAHAAAHGANGASAASAGTDDLAAAQAAIRAAAAGDTEAAYAGMDEALAGMIKKGDFSGYHLARAKGMMAEGKFKDAAYQASASLAHDPGNAEARALRAAARQHK